MPTFKDKPILAKLKEIGSASLEVEKVDMPLKVMYKDVYPDGHMERSDAGFRQEQREDDDCFMWPPESTADVLSDEDQLIWLAT